jgi:hypothetical protein
MSATIAAHVGVAIDVPPSVVHPALPEGNEEPDEKLAL